MKLRLLLLLLFFKTNFQARASGKGHFFGEYKHKLSYFSSLSAEILEWYKMKIIKIGNMPMFVLPSLK